MLPLPGRQAVGKDTVKTQYLSLVEPTFSRQWFFNLSRHQNLLEDLLKLRLLVLIPSVSDSVSLGSDPGICLSSKLRGGAAAVVQGPPFENHGGRSRREGKACQEAGEVCATT